MCDLPKAAWTILSDFAEPVCRGCVNYEGIDRVEDAILESRRLRTIETHGGPSGERHASAQGGARSNGASDGSELLCGGAMQNGGGSSATLPATAIVGSANGNGAARGSDQAMFSEDFPSPMTPYGADVSTRGYGGAIRIDMNGGYGGYGQMTGIDYMRGGIYPTEGAMAAGFYGGWRAMKRAMDDSWYYPATRQATSSRKTPQTSPEGPSSSQPAAAPPAKKSKSSHPESPVSHTTNGAGAGAIRGRASESSTSSSQSGTVAASPDSRMPVPASEPEKIAQRAAEPPADNVSAVVRESGVSTSTSQPEPTAQAASSNSSLSVSAIAPADEQASSATPRPAEKEAAPPAPSTPSAEKSSEAEATSTQEKSCEHCGCHLNSVQYVQCPSVEKHRYCLFCTYMHIEWCDAGTVSCPSKLRCPHPNSDIPWVFLPNEIDSIRKSVQLTETPAIIS